MIYRIGRATRKFLITGLVLLALLLGGIRLLLAEVQSYRSELAHQLGQAFGATVKITSLRGHLRGFKPELVLDGLQLEGDGGVAPAIQFRQIRLGVNLLDCIRYRRLLTALRVTLVGAKLGIQRKVDGSIAITGLQGGGAPPLWLLQGRHYEIVQSEVDWRDEKTPGEIKFYHHVNILIDNDRDSNKTVLQLRWAKPDNRGHRIRAVLETASDFIITGALDGRLYVQGDQFDVTSLPAKILPWAMQVTGGKSDFQLWGGLRQSKLTALSGTIFLAAGKFSGPAGQVLTLHKGSLKFDWRRLVNAWQLRIKDCNLDSNVLHWRSAAFGLQVWYDPVAEGLQAVSAFMPHFEIADLGKLALFSKQLDVAQTALWQRLQPSGIVKNVAVFAEPADQRYTFRADFNRLGWLASTDIPAVNTVNGSIRGDQQHGNVQIDMQNGQVAFPGLFRDPLTVSRFSGRLGWQQTETDWQLASPLLQLDTPDLESVNRLSLRIPKDQQPVFLDLQMAFKNFRNITHVKQYLPAGIMDPDVLAWLDQAFVGGQVTQGKGIIHGALRDFPFKQHGGVFDISFQTQGLELNVHPEWPIIKGIDAEVRFQQGGLQAEVQRAYTEDLQIKQAQAGIADLAAASPVWAKGVVAGEIPKAIAYLQKTPVRPSVDPVMEFIAPRGFTEADLDLQIPLSINEPAKVDGQAHLAGAALKVLPLAVDVETISGDLKFTEQGLSAQRITARALGDQAAVAIQQAGGQTIINIDGRAAVSNLRQIAANPLWDIAQGQTAYSLRLAFPGIGKQPASIELNSNLQGMALDLPGSLRKSTSQTRPLTLVFGFPEGALLPVSIAYNDALHAALYINKSNNSLFSGMIRFSDEAASRQVQFLKQPGIKIAVKQTNFDLAPWLQAVGPAGAIQNGADLLQTLVIDTQHLRWQDQDLGPFLLNLETANGRWQGPVSSRFAIGKVSLPAHGNKGVKPLFDMQLLDLAPLAALQTASESRVPADLPGLELKCRKLLWKTANLGVLALHAEPVANGLDFPVVELRGEGNSLNLSGRWHAYGKQAFTEAKGTLQTKALGKLLERLEITRDMQETPGNIKFALRWPGAPYQVNLAQIEGIADADLGEGRLLGVNPGIGRILGILALDQWKRRLQLDFSDAYTEGLMFNSITGHFELARGYALTDNLLIEAVPAKIEVKGRTALTSQEWDQVVVVTPKTSAALPIAGTIASKLITGAVSLVAEPEFVEGLKHLSSTAYQVKGKWGDAQVTRLHASDGLLRKAWTGMTDFSWLK